MLGPPLAAAPLQLAGNKDEDWIFTQSRTAGCVPATGSEHNLLAQAVKMLYVAVPGAKEESSIQ